MPWTLTLARDNGPAIAEASRPLTTADQAAGLRRNKNWRLLRPARPPR